MPQLMQKKKRGHLAHRGHIKENLVINGQGEHWRLHYHHIHLSSFIISNTHTEHRYGRMDTNRDHTS